MLREIKKECGVPCLSSDPPAWPWPAPFCPLVTARAGGHGQGRLGDVPLCAPSLQGRAGLAGEQPCGGAAAGGAAAGAAGAAGGRGPGRPARTAGPARCSAAPSAPGSGTSCSHCPGPRWHKHRPAARAAGWVPPPLSVGSGPCPACFQPWPEAQNWPVATGSVWRPLPHSAHAATFRPLRSQPRSAHAATCRPPSPWAWPWQWTARTHTLQWSSVPATRAASSGQVPVTSWGHHSTGSLQGRGVPRAETSRPAPDVCATSQWSWSS